MSFKRLLCIWFVGLSFSVSSHAADVPLGFLRALLKSNLGTEMMENLRPYIARGYADDLFGLMTSLDDNPALHPLRDAMSRYADEAFPLVSGYRTPSGQALETLSDSAYAEAARRFYRTLTPVHFRMLVSTIDSPFEYGAYRLSEFLPARATRNFLTPGGSLGPWN